MEKKNNLDKLKALNDYYDDNYADLCKLINRRKLFHSGDYEDVVQEAFSRALQFIHTYDEKRSIENWFLSILNNCYSDYYRTEQLKGAGSEVFDEEEFPVLGEHILSDDTAIFKVTNLIKHQPEPMRTILDLYYLKNYPPKDISKIINGWKYNSIRTLIHDFGKVIQNNLGI